MAESIYQAMRIGQSPFYKESHHQTYVRGEPMEKVDFKIPKSAYNDLMMYFKGIGLSKSEGFKGLVSDKLNTINTFKRTCFNNIEVIMMIPHSKSLEELNGRSIILTAYNTKTDFKNSFIYQDGFDKKFNINYELERFYEDSYNDIFSNLNGDVSFYFSLSNPYTSRERWNEYLKSDVGMFNMIDINDCYIVRFPLNNYLDIKREGQYQSSRLRGWHDGLYVFDDFNHHRLYFKMRWAYDGSLQLFGEFLPMTEFMYIVKNADYKKVRDCHESLLNNIHDREFMESALKDAEEMKEWIEHQIDFYKKNLGR